MEKITLNMNNTPVTQPECLHTYEIPINITRKAFEGLRRQGMSFHQAVCEIVDDAIAAVNSGVTDKYKLFIIVESIHDAKRMVEGCASIRQVNLGGTKKTPVKKAISKFIFATEQDVADIRAMVQAGAEVELRQVPSDGKIRAQDVI